MKKFNPLWLLFFCVMLLAFIVFARYKHEQRLNLRPIRDSIIFDTLHSEIVDSMN